ncbi:T9SS type A sorting domain-containing protein, partial [bacterium]|nr:T9SS type A sorting domain-containing protein [bacterium]
IRAVDTEVYSDVNVAPAFEIPVDGDLNPIQFNEDPAIYGADEFFPLNPVSIVRQTEIRGVNVILLGITPFQYNPVTKDLIVYQRIQMTVNFIGGNGHLGEDRLRSRHWEPILAQNLLNYDTLPKVDFDHLDLSDEDGCDYLIITPDDPDFISWADTLRRWRNEQGIITEVVSLSEIGGNEANLIKGYIENAYNIWILPPSAVLLLSDYQQSGDQFGITSPMYYGWPADNRYADFNDDGLPELAMARICAQDEEQLQLTINKMLSNEREPCTESQFYDKPVVAGGFQPDTWFILCCDVIAGYFEVELDKHPIREYAIYNGIPGETWSVNPNTWMIVEYFGPEGLGYIPECMSHLTDWGSNARRLNTDINNGTFIIQHRDHGSIAGWSEPSYHVEDLRDLTNNYYPYVFSMNCSTGKYHTSNQSFCEAFHRFEYGALGLMAATGTVYSFVNDTYTWGVYDSMWPDFDPFYGSESRAWDLRPGFGNVGGKYYLSASSWPINPQCSHLTYQLFHHFGDAFMSLYSQLPESLYVNHRPTLEPGSTIFSIEAEEDALIGLSLNGDCIASVTATGVMQNIPIDPLGADQTLRVTVTKTNHFRYIAHVVSLCGGRFSLNDLEEEPVITSEQNDRFEVEEPYPLPFNPTTILTFFLPQPGEVEIRIFDLLGRDLTEQCNLPVLSYELTAGKHRVTLDTSNLASGVYLYQITASNEVHSGKLILMR